MNLNLIFNLQRTLDSYYIQKSVKVVWENNDCYIIRIMCGKMKRFLMLRQVVCIGKFVL
jgi:hypothetical protein